MSAPQARVASGLKRLQVNVIDLTVGASDLSEYVHRHKASIRQRQKLLSKGTSAWLVEKIKIKIKEKLLMLIFKSFLTVVGHVVVTSRCALAPLIKNRKLNG